MKKLTIIGALPESLINFRGALIQSLCKANCQVTCMASISQPKVTQQLMSWGVIFSAYPVHRSSLNPLADLKTWHALRQAFRALQPDIILAYTIKPVIWGGLASRVTPSTRFYALITGLGFAFQGESLKRKILSQLVTLLYRAALKRATKVIFQNPDNLNEFVSRGIIPKDKCELVNGSGVDIQSFSFMPAAINSSVTFLSIGRLLGEKGFREYAEAAKIVKEIFPETTFQLLGPEDSSPDGIPMKEVAEWQHESIIKYLGSASDVRPFIELCDVYVLPSYHEGMPRTVLEAMAIGRPILTTDVPGCRETVIQGENGYLVPKADAGALAKQMIWFIENQSQREKMGKESRKIAEDKYDVRKINKGILKIMEIK
jgi:glycosyltransferase involved in cell wall biosynthesis